MESYTIAATIAKYLLLRPVLVFSVGVIAFLAAWLTAWLLKAPRLVWWKPVLIVVISYVAAISIGFAANPLILKIEMYTRFFISAILLLATSIGAAFWVLKGWKRALAIGLVVVVVSAAAFVGFFSLGYALGDYAFRAAQTS